MRVFRIALGSALVAASAVPIPAGSADARKPATAAEVHAFVEQMNTDYRRNYIEPNAAEWIAET